MIDKGLIPMVAGTPKVGSVAAAGTLVTGWVDCSLQQNIQAIVAIGSGAGTPAITWEQATSSGGAGAKALAWGAGTFVTDRVEVTNDCGVLDLAGGFRYVRATVTITGGAGTLTALLLLGLTPRFAS